MLTDAYRRGWAHASQKLALNAPTPADEFVANIDQGQDVPPPGMEGMGEMPPMHPPAPFPGQPGALEPQQPPEPKQLLQDLQQPPQEDLGMMAAKAASLGLKDMLFFEKMMGPQEASSMFKGIEGQMSGQGGGFHGTLNIGPGGVQRTPMPKPAAPMPRPAASAQGLGAQAAGHVISSAPPPRPTPPPIPAAAMRR